VCRPFFCLCVVCVLVYVYVCLDLRCVIKGCVLCCLVLYSLVLSCLVSSRLVSSRLVSSRLVLSWSCVVLCCVLCCPLLSSCLDLSFLLWFHIGHRSLVLVCTCRYLSMWKFPPVPVFAPYHRQKMKVPVFCLRLCLVSCVLVSLFWSRPWF
jgi:hypothetical protein